MKNLFLTFCLFLSSFIASGQNTLIIPGKDIFTNGINTICLNIPNDNYTVEVIEKWTDKAKVQTNATGLPLSKLQSLNSVNRYQYVLRVTNDTLWVTFACVFNQLPNEVLSWTIQVPSHIKVVRMVRPINEIKLMNEFVQ